MGDPDDDVILAPLEAVLLTEDEFKDAFRFFSVSESGRDPSDPVIVPLPHGLPPTISSIFPKFAIPFGFGT